MSPRLRRSALYIPGSNPRAMAKCRTVDADVIVFDLEDAVADADKAGAFEAVVAQLAQRGFGHREVAVRINGLATDRGHRDLPGIAAARPDAILLPKVAGPDDVRRAATHLDDIGAAASVRLWAMVETPDAVLDVHRLARAAADPASRLDVLVMGTNDLAKDLRVRITPNRDALLVWLSICVAAARSQRLEILDGVFNDLDDMSGLSREARQGRDFGMDGKTCIHPGQIAACNAAFAPRAGRTRLGPQGGGGFRASTGARRRPQDRRSHGRALACRGGATRHRHRLGPGGTRPWRAVVRLGRPRRL